MSTHTTRSSLEQTPRDQPAAQAAPEPKPRVLTTTRAMAERHEALWLALTALHKDVLALGAKKPAAPVPDGLRILAEGLLSDCAALIRRRGERLPVAAPDLAGLAAQLGQGLAGIEGWESQHTSWDERFHCRIWQVPEGYLPIMRLKPPAAALNFKRMDVSVLREKLDERFTARRLRDFYNGFGAGRRMERENQTLADVEASWRTTYPRLRLFD